jgi:hypothetical protein
MNNMSRFERIWNYCQGRVVFFWLLKRQCLAYKKMFGFLSVFGDPGPLLNGDGCIKYPDMPSELGIRKARSKNSKPRTGLGVGL